MISRSQVYLKGFTIVEMVVTIVVLAIALVGVAAMVGRGTSENANTLLETRTIALGHAYLDEVMGRRFDEQSRPGRPPCYGLATDPGPPSRPCTDPADFGPTDNGENSRARFDDVDDYHGLDEGDGQANPLRDAEGDDRSGYENYRVRIEVRYAGTDTVAGAGRNLTDAKLVTVTVSHRAQADGYKFSAYKANF